MYGPFAGVHTCTQANNMRTCLPNAFVPAGIGSTTMT